MDISIKTIGLFGSVLLTGLSAGLFFAWSVSVIPGTQKVTDATYLEAMQSINRAILNVPFFLIFIGSIVFLSVASVYQYHESNITFWLLLVSSIFYLLGTVGITGLGNVPLNDQLNMLKLAEMDSGKMAEFRKFYETNWNKLHLIRTIFAVASFVVAVLAILLYSKH